MRKLRLATIALLVPIFSGSAQAENWPTRSIKTIVPFPAGGAVDVIARVVMDQVAAQVGKPIVIENRTGAGGTLGAAQTASAEPDGHTLLLHSVAHTIAPATFARLPYDPVRDLIAIAPVAKQPQVLVVPPSRDYRTLKEFVTWASARRESLTYASVGVGSGAHFTAERFIKSAGLKATHVPFAGTPQALPEVMMGRVDFFISPLLPAMPLIKQGKILALAIPSAGRSTAFPDVPTTLEAGFADSEFDFWCGLFAPAKTPAAIVQRLHTEVNIALKNPVVLERLAKLSAEPMSGTTSEFKAFIDREIAANKAMAKSIGLQPK